MRGNGFQRQALMTTLAVLLQGAQTGQDELLSSSRGRELHHEDSQVKLPERSMENLLDAR